MTTDATEIATLSPADMLTAAHMDPETRVLLIFLANRTPLTRSAYEQDLRAYKTWTLNFGLPSMLLTERHHAELYLEQLKARGLAEATVARRFGTMRLFLRMAYEEDVIKDDPCKRIKPPKIDHDRQRRTWLSTTAMARVMEVAGRNPFDNALMTFMTATAMRVGEVCGLDVEDVHRDTGRVWVGFAGKGGHFARIDLPYAVVAALDTYLDGRSTGPLFLNQYERRITRQNVAVVLERLIASAGVAIHDTGGKGRVTPHGIRRTHAKTLAEHGADLLDISESLRHKDSRVTRTAYIGTATGRANMARQRVADIFGNMTS